MDYDEVERLAEIIFSNQIADALRRANPYRLNEKNILLDALRSYVVSIHPNDRDVANKIIKAIEDI